MNPGGMAGGTPFFCRAENVPDFFLLLERLLELLFVTLDAP